jgi:hypothetical protein
VGDAAGVGEALGVGVAFWVAGVCVGLDAAGRAGVGVGVPTRRSRCRCGVCARAACGSAPQVSVKMSRKDESRADKDFLDDINSDERNYSHGWTG